MSGKLALGLVQECYKSSLERFPQESLQLINILNIVGTDRTLSIWILVG